MLINDSYGNNVVITVYESCLSKTIVESRELYQELYFKISTSIKEVVDFNSENEKFKRRLYAVFSTINDEFPGHENINDLLKKDFNLYAANQFYKYFFENLINYATLPKRSNQATHLASLTELVQTKIGASDSLVNKLRFQTDSGQVFADKNRGRIEIESDFEGAKTTKLGITEETNTPAELVKYFSKLYEPGQSQFKRDYNSQISKWLQKRNLPFVSGPSGTAGTCLCGMFQLCTYSQKELKLYFMVLAASLVARGHHSFVETELIAQKIGFPIKDNCDFHAYYEQFLTQEFIQSEKYHNFLITMANLKEESLANNVINRIAL